MARFGFDFGSPLALPLRLTGIGPRVTSVRVENGILDVRFGLLRVRTPAANIADVSVTGPYSALKTLGVHVSLADRGVTFGTSYRQGVCIRFARPVSGVLPMPLLSHRALTLTVAEPLRLQEALLAARDEAAAETAVEPARDLAEPVTPAADSVDAWPPSSAAKRIPAKKTAARRAIRRTTTATPADIPSKRAVKKTAKKAAAKTVDQELSARRLAGNLPDDEPIEPAPDEAAVTPAPAPEDAKRGDQGPDGEGQPTQTG